MCRAYPGLRRPFSASSAWAGVATFGWRLNKSSHFCSFLSHFVAHTKVFASLRAKTAGVGIEYKPYLTRDWFLFFALLNHMCG